MQVIATGLHLLQGIIPEIENLRESGRHLSTKVGRKDAQGVIPRKDQELRVTQGGRGETVDHGALQEREK